MENLLKIGYFRRVDSLGRTSYISYKEYYTWDEARKMRLKASLDANECNLYCACCLDNTLELSVTSNLVVRVRSNHQQENHMDSCPKSIYYSHWNETEGNGIQRTEDEEIIFNIALPSAVKNQSTSSSNKSNSSKSGSSEPKTHRTNILDTAITLNKMAWEKQTFSKKREIKEANKAGLPQTWEYKSNKDFIRLIFGMSNDILTYCRGEVIPFINLCYRKDLFYACEDYRMQWFIYAPIEKISEVKRERKYQYVTVGMPSNKSNTRAAIRIETEHFDKIMEGFEEEKEGMHRILAGYVCRRYFKGNGDAESASDWIQLIKGVVFYVSNNGLYVENERVAAAINYMCDKRILFKRPYAPLENYGSEIPTILVERLNQKNMILDFPLSEKDYTRHCSFVENNSEFECHVFSEEENVVNKLEDILEDI